MDESAATRATNSGEGIGEDWLAAALGLLIVALGMLSLSGPHLLGWTITTRVWTDLSAALAPVSSTWASLGGFGSLVLTWLVLLAVLCVGAKLLRTDVRRFALAFTAVFWIAYACWILGSQANLAVNTPADAEKFGVSWSLKLTNEGGYIIALLAGLAIGNFAPGFANWLSTAIRPELYIKTAIVILGAFIAVTAAERASFAASLVVRGVAAIVEAYLIYWAVVYWVCRRWFGFSREWSAPLASGISICGVSAAISVGGAIRARPLVPVVVSSLVVVFAVVELLVLPFLAREFLWREPLVAASWMGLSIKTDGAAVAGGGITESLILAEAAAHGIRYEPGWMLSTTATIKVFIDIFIGIWAFVLAWIWTRHINPRQGDVARAREIWQRFPKFIIGYVLTFLVVLLLCLGSPPELLLKVKSVIGDANQLRVIFFVLTFFSIGVLSNFRRLWEEGLAKLAAVYVLCLFGFIVWVGLLISWIFFHGVRPPLAGA